MRDVKARDAQAITDYRVHLVERDERPRSDDGDEPSVRGPEDAGVVTRDAGLMLRTRDGQEYQIGVARSPQATSAEDGLPLGGRRDPRPPGRRPGSGRLARLGAHQYSGLFSPFCRFDPSREESGHETRP
jgi:hypothetical protein